MITVSSGKGCGMILNKNPDMEVVAEAPTA